MKVLMISTDRNIFSERSAVRERMLSYASQFSELHIIVFTKKMGSEKLVNTKIADNCHVYPTNSLSKLLYIWHAIHIGAQIFKGWELDGGQYPNDVVISSQDPFETGLVGKRLHDRFGAGFNVQIHTDFLSDYFKKETFLNRIRVYIARIVVAQADSIRVVSERIKKSLVSNPRYAIEERKISVLPIFIDAEAIKSARIIVDVKAKYPRWKKIVLMASRITHEKDIPTALRAFRGITISDPNVGMLIVGSGPESEKAKKLMNNLGLQGLVAFEPWVDRDVLISYMKTADVFLSSSLYEGYGMAMVEATVCGLPVVATDAGIAPEVSVAPVVPPGDDWLLGNTLEKVLREPKRSVIPNTVGSKSEYLKKYTEILSQS